MGTTLNYWNVPNSGIVGLGNSGTGTNNVGDNGANAKTLLTAEASGTYGTRIFSIAVSASVTGKPGGDTLNIFNGTSPSSTAPLYYKVSFVNQVIILFDDGKLPIPAGTEYQVVHLPKLIVPSGQGIQATHINDDLALWVYTQGGDGG